MRDENWGKRKGRKKEKKKRGERGGKVLFFGSTEKVPKIIF